MELPTWRDFWIDLILTKSRKMRETGHVARMAEMRNAYKIMFGKLENLGKMGN
jgi:hypothetical protein